MGALQSWEKREKERNKARRKNKLFIQSLILGNYHFRGCFSRPFVNYFEIPSYLSHDLSPDARVKLSTINVPNSQKLWYHLLESSQEWYSCMSIWITTSFLSRFHFPSKQINRRRKIKANRKRKIKATEEII